VSPSATPTTLPKSCAGFAGADSSSKSHATYRTRGAIADLLGRDYVFGRAVVQGPVISVTRTQLANQRARCMLHVKTTSRKTDE
jgi:hypothetical protein